MHCCTTSICTSIAHTHHIRGSAIARIVGSNATKHAEFQSQVKMWVFEEMINGKKLTEIINTQHENVKYLPGFKLPENVVSLQCSAPQLSVLFGPNIISVSLTNSKIF